MKGILTAIGILAVLYLGWTFFGRSDPKTTAQVKCEFALESLTGYDIGIMEVSRSSVTGDVFNGTVEMPFDVSGRTHHGLCDFADGKIQAIRLDGKLLAGQ